MSDAFLYSFLEKQVSLDKNKILFTLMQSGLILTLYVKYINEMLQLPAHIFTSVLGCGCGGARNVWTFRLLTRVVHNTGSGHVFAFFTSRENTANMAFLGEGGMGNVFLWCRKRDFCSQICFH